MAVIAATPCLTTLGPLARASHRCQVVTTFRGKTYSTTTDSVGVGVPGLGTWRQALPPTVGGTTEYTLNFSSSAGDRASIEDVLFGEVFLCSGQSNMCVGRG